MPREDRLAQEVQTTRPVHPPRLVTRLKRSLVRAQEAPGERMARLPAVELALDPVAEVGLLERGPPVLLGLYPLHRLRVALPADPPPYRADRASGRGVG